MANHEAYFCFITLTLVTLNVGVTGLQDEEDKVPTDI